MLKRDISKALLRFKTEQVTGCTMYLKTTNESLQENVIPNRKCKKIWLKLYISLYISEHRHSVCMLLRTQNRHMPNFDLSKKFYLIELYKVQSWKSEAEGNLRIPGPFSNLSWAHWSISAFQEADTDFDFWSSDGLEVPRFFMFLWPNVHHSHLGKYSKEDSLLPFFFFLRPMSFLFYISLHHSSLSQ